MNYQKHYDNLIKNRWLNPPADGVYKEVHHILPTACGGGDEKTNLVVLTAKEHFTAHLLLAQIYPKDSEERKKMVTAVFLMSHPNKKFPERFVTGNVYKRLRKERSKTHQNNKYSKGYRWVNDPDMEYNKWVAPNEPIPEGCIMGRVIRFTTEKQFLEEGSRLDRWRKIQLRNQELEENIKKEMSMDIKIHEARMRAVLKKHGAKYIDKSYTKEESPIGFECKCGEVVITKTWLDLKNKFVEPYCPEC